MTLHPGDMILTGTPSGVGPIENGDLLEGNISQHGTVLADLNFRVEKQDLIEAKL